LSGGVRKLTKDIPAETLRRECRAGVPVIRVCEVIERRQIDCENTDCRDADGDCGHDPVHVAEARPAEHEEADGHARALDAGKVQAALWRVGEFAVLAREFFLVDGEDGCEDGGGAHGGEDGVGLLQAEAVVGLEDERDGGEG